MILILISIPLLGSCKSTKSEKNEGIDDSIIMLRVAEDAAWFMRFHEIENARELTLYSEFESLCAIDVKTTDDGNLEFKALGKEYPDAVSLFHFAGKLKLRDPDVKYGVFVDPDVTFRQLREFLKESSARGMSVFIGSRSGFWRCHHVHGPDDAMRIPGGDEALKINITDSFRSLESDGLRKTISIYISNQVEKDDNNEVGKKRILLVSAPSETKCELLSAILDLCRDEKTGIKTIYLVDG